MFKGLTLLLAAMLTNSPALAQTASDPMPAAVPQAQAAPAAAAPIAPVSPGDGYKLGVNDEIEISIFSTTNQVVKTRIKEDGTVTVPFLGNVRAVDSTARELATRIADQLRSGGFLLKPIVNVDVTQFVSNSVTVLGNVATPGIYPMDRDLTVAMLVARAGGARTDGADYAMLRRRGDPVEHRVDFGTVGSEWSGATAIIAGDTVYVPPIPIYFAYGQVNTPGAFPIRTGMTIRQALARAGGPTLAGSQKNITLFRGEKKIKKIELDEKIQPNDTLYINERFF